MLIDPQGLFYGERINACSDEAQLHFPRLMAAANGFGRIEMSVTKLHSTVYAAFKKKPTREQLQKWFREYHANFLLFVYRSESGSVWGQWAVSKGKLPKWKTAEDKRSPAPREDELEAYQRAYVEAKRAKYENQRDQIAISEDFQSLPKASEDFRGFPRGEVVGEVEVEVEILAPTSSTRVTSRRGGEVRPEDSHPLFTNARLAILAFWDKHVQPGASPSWDGSEAKALAGLLKATPGLTLERIRVMLENRAQSDVTMCERPRKWIPSLTSYEFGPLDAFGKPKALRKAAAAGVTAIQAAPDALRTAEQLKAEEDGRRAILRDWREARDRGDPAYETEAPRWVREALDGEPEARAVA